MRDINAYIYVLQYSAFSQRQTLLLTRAICTIIIVRYKTVRGHKILMTGIDSVFHVNAILNANGKH